MTSSEPLWRIEIITNAAAQPVLSAALEEESAALSAFELTPGGEWRIEALMLEEPSAKQVQAQLAGAIAPLKQKAPAFKIEQLPETDWLAQNRRSFPPLRIGRYFIYGSHYHGPKPPGAVAVRLDASIAFGSGEHATTRGCLLALDSLTKRRRPRRVLDVGCGSGILSLAAVKNGPARAVATDNDRDSVRLARENVRDNGLSMRRMACRWANGTSRVRRNGFDLVFANILAKPLRRLSRDISRTVAPGGVLVLSGLLAPQSADVIEAYRFQGLHLTRVIAISGWHALVLRRRRR